MANITRIGVCGHRNLPACEIFQPALAQCTKFLKNQFPTNSFQVTSCLAEGADQLLASHFMDTLAASLCVLIPLPLDDYKRDFINPNALSRLEALLSSANQLLSTPPNAVRPQAYQQANILLVKNIDLLVAIWDGRVGHGPGGTWEVVATARANSLPLVHLLLNRENNLVSLRSENFRNLLPNEGGNS